MSEPTPGTDHDRDPGTEDTQVTDDSEGAPRRAPAEPSDVPTDGEEPLNPA